MGVNHNYLHMWCIRVRYVAVHALQLYPLPSQTPGFLGTVPLHHEPDVRSVSVGDSTRQSRNEAIFNIEVICVSRNTDHQVPNH